MIVSRSDLKICLEADAKNYSAVIGKGRYRNQLFSTPISDQWYIWRYIKTMRFCEFYSNKTGTIYKLMYCWYLYRLRKLSRITGFQIPPNTVGPGITIWHWGSIIINPAAKIGNNCTLIPTVIIGHKKAGEGAPIIGDNVFIGGGAKIIGNLKIGDNVKIAPNVVVRKDVPPNVSVGNIPCEIIK